MSNIAKPTAFAWAAFYGDGCPTPFVNVNSVRRIRVEVMEYIGFAWNPADFRDGWNRAYRNGARIIRVSIKPAFDHKPEVSHDA